MGHGLGFTCDEETKDGGMASRGIAQYTATTSYTESQATKKIQRGPSVIPCTLLCPAVCPALHPEPETELAAAGSEILHHAFRQCRPYAPPLPKAKPPSASVK